MDSSTFAELLKVLETQFRNGDYKAGFELGTLVDPENEVIQLKLRQEFGVSSSELVRIHERTFDLLQEAASTGDGEAMHLIAIYYQSGTPPVEHSMEACREWCERALEAGFLFAANDLYTYHKEHGSFKEAQRYWNIIEEAQVRVAPE